MPFHTCLKPTSKPPRTFKFAKELGVAYAKSKNEEFQTNYFAAEAQRLIDFHVATLELENTQLRECERQIRITVQAGNRDLPSEVSQRIHKLFETERELFALQTRLTQLEAAGGELAKAGNNYAACELAFEIAKTDYRQLPFDTEVKKAMDNKSLDKADAAKRFVKALTHWQTLMSARSPKPESDPTSGN